MAKSYIKVAFRMVKVDPVGDAGLAERVVASSITKRPGPVRPEALERSKTRHPVDCMLEYSIAGRL
jgi:hypothetical protein